MTADKIKAICADLAEKQKQLFSQIEQNKAQLNQVIGAQIAYHDMLSKLETQNEPQADESQSAE